jgi:hypothetical protein
MRQERTVDKCIYPSGLQEDRKVGIDAGLGQIEVDEFHFAA